MSTYVSHGFGWCCVDCLFMLANGENESWDEWETYAWEKTVEARLGDVSVDLGGEHVEGCPNIAQGTGEVADESGKVFYRTDNESLGEAIARLSPHTFYDAPSQAGTWLGTSDCDCERDEFSWRPCDVCGSRLGGSRDAVHFFKYDETREGAA